MLYRKVLEKYEGSLPSDAVLLFELVDEHGFNEIAAEKAIRVFRASLDFVNHKTDSVGDTIYNEEDEDFKEEEFKDPQQLMGQPQSLQPYQQPPS